MTARRWTVVALLALLWCYAMWTTRHVDSDTGLRSLPSPTADHTGEGVAQRWGKLDAGTVEGRALAPKASRSRAPRTSSRDLPNGRLNWAALAQCESSGNPRAVSPSGRYRGLYQMDADFWRTYGGLRYAPRPDLATSAEQTAVAKRGYAARGRQPWPTCGRRL